MRDRNLQINNSYESEQSHSTTSLSDGLTNLENKSFDNNTTNLVDMLRCEIGKGSELREEQPNAQDHLYCLNDNPVCRNGICSSQESDFEGYTFSEMAVTPSNYIHVVNHNKKCNYSKSSIEENGKDSQSVNHNFVRNSLNTKGSNSLLNNNEDTIKKKGQIHGIVSSEKGSELKKEQPNAKDHLYCLNDNPVCRNGIFSSQESDFGGYTFSEMEITPSNYIHVVNHKKKCDYSKSAKQENEKDFQIVNRNFDINRLNTKGSNSSFNTNEDIIQNERQIYVIVSSENSCNAVDMVITKETEEISDNSEPSTSCLSFNGRINTNDCADSSSSVSTYTSNDKAGDLNCFKIVKETMKYINEKSPDLFEDDDSSSDTANNKDKIDIDDITIEDNEISRNGVENIVQRRDNEHLKRMRNSLLGLPPPPSVTIMQIDMFNRVASCKEKIFDFFQSEFFQQSKDKKIDGQTNGKSGSFLKPTHTIEEIKNMNWPNILKCNQHGLSYNLSKTSEKIELLNLSVIERYIGAETSSSYNANATVSSAKKRNNRLKMLSQSPGSRLSHLAKRRAIFSSANLQSTLQANVAVSLNASKVNNRQILLDSRQSENRRKSKIITPKRKKIGRKTPTSSSRKRCAVPASTSSARGPSRETSKRALFQSPPTQKPIPKICLKPEIANRVEKSKRALFSPFKSQESNSSQENSILFNRINNNYSSGSVYENSNKRKRCEDDVLGNSQKIFRSEFTGMPTPRSLKTKSQSFCIGAANSATMDQNSLAKALCRTRSDTVFNSSQLSESHKKKLLWAVSQALQNKQVSSKHPSFKLYASTLARVAKRIYLETDEKGISTSDRMLKIAKKYVYWVIQGKSADDIYLSEKAKLQYEKQSSRTKLSGYIAPEEYENRKLFLKKTSSSLLLENDSNCAMTLSQSLIGFSQSSSQMSANSDMMGQTLHDSQIMRDQSFTSAKKQFIQTNKTLQNSSSKNNLCGTTALRENIDCEQRKSAQKCFTGKDQKNVSPYRDSSLSGRQKHTSNLFDANAMKAKRQITFDN